MFTFAFAFPFLFPFLLLPSAMPTPAGTFDDLFNAMQGELRELARGMMAGERRSHTLQATALVNEAYVRLVRSDDLKINDKAHFFHMAALTMKRLLVEHARARGRIKRGGEHGPRASLDEAFAPAADEGRGGGEGGDEAVSVSVAPDEHARLEAALAKLGEEDERMAEVVRMRFLGGMSMEAIARALGVSERGVYNDWRFAKARLRRLLEEAGMNVPE